jgi:hypothetical protein
MFLLRHNRRLLWAVLGAAAWAYLGIAAALAQAGGDVGAGGPRPYGGRADQHERGGRPGLHLRLPPGAVRLPGRVVEVSEQGGRLHIALEVKDEAARVLRGAMGEELEQGPPDVDIEYLTPQEAAGRELSVSTQAGETAPLRLPGGKQVVVGENWFVGLNRQGAALIPHDGSGRRLLSEHRGFWRKGERRPPGMDGGPGPGERFRDGDRERMDGRQAGRQERRSRWRWPWEKDREAEKGQPPADRGRGADRKRRGPDDRDGRGPGGRHDRGPDSHSRDVEDKGPDGRGSESQGQPPQGPPPDGEQHDPPQGGEGKTPQVPPAGGGGKSPQGP